MVGENREPTPICIDSRSFGSKARFARASCRPNIKVQHFFLKGKLHIIGVAAGNIERGEEVMIRFYFLLHIKFVSVSDHIEIIRSGSISVKSNIMTKFG